MKKICRGDKVVVITGGCKGSVGIVKQVLVKENRVIIEGVNKAMKRVKSNENGENFVEKEMPIHISNVAIADKKTDKPIKVGFSFNKSKIKIRVNKKTGEEIPKNI